MVLRLFPSLLLTLLITCLGGCNSYGLRYEAKPQPQGAHIYADYTPLQDAIGVSIDSNGGRIEAVTIKLPDGTLVPPLNLVLGTTAQSAAVATGVGFGSGGVGVGTGIGFPVGPQTTYGLSTATFSQSAIGPPPWELHIKIQGLPEVTVPGLGGPPTAK